MDDAGTREVIRGLREGSPEAWRVLYDAHAERVWLGVARRLGPQASDVADVVQETMLAAARSARSFDESKGTLWQWLWGIAQMQIALHFRRQKRHERKYAGEWLAASRGRLARWLEGSGESPTDLLESAELAECVRDTLHELPDDYELLLAAKYLDGESVEQIAVRERTTSVAVRSKLARARQAFRRAFAGISGRQNDVETSHAHP